MDNSTTSFHDNNNNAVNTSLVTETGEVTSESCIITPSTNKNHDDINTSVWKEPSIELMKQRVTNYSECAVAQLMTSDKTLTTRATNGTNSYDDDELDPAGFEEADFGNGDGDNDNDTHETEDDNLKDLYNMNMINRARQHDNDEDVVPKTSTWTLPSLLTQSSSTIGDIRTHSHTSSRSWDGDALLTDDSGSGVKMGVNLNVVGHNTNPTASSSSSSNTDLKHAVRVVEDYDDHHNHHDDDDCENTTTETVAATTPLHQNPNSNTNASEAYSSPSRYDNDNNVELGKFQQQQEQEEGITDPSNHEIDSTTREISPKIDDTAQQSLMVETSSQDLNTSITLFTPSTPIKEHRDDDTNQRENNNATTPTTEFDTLRISMSLSTTTSNHHNDTSNNNNTNNTNNTDDNGIESFLQRIGNQQRDKMEKFYNGMMDGAWCQSKPCSGGGGGRNNTNTSGEYFEEYDSLDGGSGGVNYFNCNLLRSPQHSNNNLYNASFDVNGTTTTSSTTGYDPFNSKIVGPPSCEYCGSKSTLECRDTCDRPTLYFAKKRPPFRNLQVVNGSCGGGGGDGSSGSGSGGGEENRTVVVTDGGSIMMTPPYRRPEEVLCVKRHVRQVSVTSQSEKEVGEVVVRKEEEEEPTSLKRLFGGLF